MIIKKTKLALIILIIVFAIIVFGESKSEYRPYVDTYSKSNKIGDSILYYDSSYFYILDSIIYLHDKDNDSLFYRSENGYPLKFSINDSSVSIMEEHSQKDKILTDIIEKYIPSVTLKAELNGYLLMGDSIVFDDYNGSLYEFKKYVYNSTGAENGNELIYYNYPYFIKSNDDGLLVYLLNEREEFETRAIYYNDFPKYSEFVGMSKYENKLYFVNIEGKKTMANIALNPHNLYVRWKDFKKDSIYCLDLETYELSKVFETNKNEIIIRYDNRGAYTISKKGLITYYSFFDNKENIIGEMTDSVSLISNCHDYIVFYIENNEYDYDFTDAKILNLFDTKRNIWIINTKE